MSSAPQDAKATATIATRRQPNRSATRPASGTDAAEQPEQEDQAGGRVAERERRALQAVLGVREDADEAEEETRAEGGGGEQRAVARHRGERDAERGALHRRRLLRRERALHDDRGGQRQERDRAERASPANRCGQERHTDPSDQAADDQRPHVPAHHPGPVAPPERRHDVRHADREQTRHAEPLRDPAREQEPEARRERRERRGNDEQRARGDQRAPPADAIGERAPQPGPERDREDQHGDRQPGSRGTHAEARPELGQDRLGRVHRREHPCRPEQEPGERDAVGSVRHRHTVRAISDIFQYQ